ncbi:MAG TPA: hypothetical protein VJV79_16690 [Polyangiaceae bacterium]|nr:hypothetical protein [Polyangiaceae bacterium]
MHISKRFPSLCRLSLVATLTWFGPRSAQADVTGAARAFAEGQAAQLEGNHALAAERFELAFTLQPSKEALRSAARMQMSAENFARAATHAQTLLDRFGEDAQSAELGRSILEDVASRLARYEVSCTSPCALLVDNLAYFLEAARQHRLYLNPGRVSLEARFASGRKASRSVATSAGETARIKLKEPEAPPSSAVARDTSAANSSPHEPERSPTPAPVAANETSKGLPVIVPWLTGAATVACGALTLWAALDTRRQHAEYVEHPTEEKWNDGVARQKLTNVLLASTAALAATTVTLTFFVRSSDNKSVGVSPALGPTSAALAVTGRF